MDEDSQAAIQEALARRQTQQQPPQQGGMSSSMGGAPPQQMSQPMGGETEKTESLLILGALIKRLGKLPVPGEVPQDQMAQPQMTV